MNTSYFGTVSTVILTLLDNGRTETYFKLSDGTTSRTYIFGIDQELRISDQVTFITESVIIINTLAQPVPAETFSFELGAVIVGVNPGTDIVSTQRSSRGLVEVLAPAGG